MWKYIAVIFITIGICIVTIASGKDIKNSVADATLTTTQSMDQFSSFFWWLCGIFLLSCALFLSARMGLYQEVMYKKRGKHANEALFYTHFLSLPAFALISQNIFNHYQVAMTSEKITIPLMNNHITMPLQALNLIVNFSSHYLCVNCVYILTSECTSLTVTLVVTLRKFASLLFSIIYFQHPFTFYHWQGTTLIVIGTLIYTDIGANLCKFTEFKLFKDINLGKNDNNNNNNSNCHDEEQQPLIK
jgi:UDP-xylose/UDP-N-acetylglucosamine transporter B4